MSGEKDTDMTWNFEKDLLMVNYLIKTPFWNEASQFDFNIKCHLRELLQKCSGGNIVEMLKWLLSAEEKTALVKIELQSFFQSQTMQSFENHLKIKYEVEVKQEPGSEVELGPEHKHESSSLRNLRLKRQSEPEPEMKNVFWVLGGGKGYFRHHSKLFYIKGIGVGQTPIFCHF